MELTPQNNLAMEQTIYDKIFEFLKLTWLVIISVISPIRLSVIILLAFFTFNFFVGYKTDQKVHKREFSLNKAFDSVKQLILYYALIFLVNMTLGLYEEVALAEGAAKFLTWVISFWYLVNILRNARLMFPTNEAIKFLHEFLTIQLLDIILARFGFRSQKDRRQNKHNEGNEEEEEHHRR